MSDIDNEILVLDEEYKPLIIAEECSKISTILSDFIKVYADNKDKSTAEWLAPKIKEELPDSTPEKAKEIADEIISSIGVYDEKKESLLKAKSQGRSKESWFAGEIKNVTASLSAKESSEYLTSLDNSLKKANAALEQTIRTQSGAINLNPNLDGYIAEQYHAQTFNMNAEASGSQFRAKVLEPSETGYAKNSVDIEIYDIKTGKVVKRYQSKFCKDAEASARAFEHGDYRGQQKLVPEGQKEGIGKKAVEVITAPDGTTSNPLKKSHAMQMRDEAQSGTWNELNWNEYAAKDLAIGIANQAGKAAALGAVVNVGLNIVQKLHEGEDIDGEEVVKAAVSGGADLGVKVAAAGALKVGAEKGIISALPKGTSAGVISAIAFTAVDNIKIAAKVAEGELTALEGVDKMAETTVSTVASMAAMSKGAAIGAKLGTVFGPVGSAIGGAVGGMIGGLAGSTVGKAICNGAKKICKTAVAGVTHAVERVGNVVSNAFNTLKSWVGF